MTTKFVPFAVLDADDQGARLCLLAEYHGFYKALWEQGEVTNEDYAETMYLLGNIEGRLLYGHVTQRDIELMDLWSEELQDKGPHLCYKPIQSVSSESAADESCLEKIALLLKLRSVNEHLPVWARAAYTESLALLRMAMDENHDGIEAATLGWDEKCALDNYAREHSDQ